MYSNKMERFKSVSDSGTCLKRFTATVLQFDTQLAFTYGLPVGC